MYGTGGSVCGPAPVTGMFVDGDNVAPDWAKYAEFASVPPAEVSV